MSDLSEEYHPLLALQPEAGTDPSIDPQLDTRRKLYNIDPFFLAAIVTLLFLSSISAFTLLTPTASSTDKQYPNRRLSQYTLLKRSYDQNHNNSAGPGTLKFSHAQISLQMDKTLPTRRLIEHNRQYSTSLGTVYPDDRHFIVSPRFSTIIQLRTVDFGFEKCLLSAALPIQTSNLISNVSFTPGSIVDIWMLEGNDELSRYTENWYYAPPRRQHFAKLVFSDETWNSPVFLCPPNTFFTFEFTCNTATNADCYVEFWQDRESLNGIFLSQKK